MLRGLTALVLTLLGMSAAWAQASVQAWPSKQPIRVVVPIAAGSGTDLTARLVFEQVSNQIGQAIVVENRVGAGGIIGTNAVAKAEPDGYTILMTPSSHTVTPAAVANLPFDTIKDFSAVIPLVNVPNVLVVAPDKGYKSAQDFAAAAKARSEGVNYASTGAGNASHLNAERFRLAAGFEAVHVPYGGAPQALTEVMTGRVDFYFSPLSPALPFLRDGKLQALAVAGKTRSSALPNVPTTTEAGFSNSEYEFWFGAFVPSATPRAIVQRLHEEIAKALAHPAVRTRLTNLGADPMPMTPAEFDAFLQKEVAENIELVKAAGIKVN